MLWIYTICKNGWNRKLTFDAPSHYKNGGQKSTSACRKTLSRRNEKGGFFRCCFFKQTEGSKGPYFYTSPGWVIKKGKVPVATILPAVSVTAAWMTDSFWPSFFG